MPVFAIIAPQYNPPLEAMIRAKFPRHYQIAPGQYVVNAAGPTAQAISNELGMGGQVGKFVVFSVAGHWGYHDKPLWEWLTLNSG